jgi:hypothetical protein
MASLACLKGRAVGRGRRRDRSLEVGHLGEKKRADVVNRHLGSLTPRIIVSAVAEYGACPGHRADGDIGV